MNAKVGTIGVMTIFVVDEHLTPEIVLPLLAPFDCVQLTGIEPSTFRLELSKLRPDLDVVELIEIPVISSSFPINVVKF